MEEKPWSGMTRHIIQGVKSLRTTEKSAVLQSSTAEKYFLVWLMIRRMLSLFLSLEKQGLGNPCFARRWFAIGPTSNYFKCEKTVKSPIWNLGICSLFVNWIFLKITVWLKEKSQIFPRYWVTNVTLITLHLTALVLFNQWDYLNHSNKDSDRLIAACLIRV